MHLVDGTIPLIHAAAYAGVSGTVAAFGIREYYIKSKEKLDYKIICGAFTALVFAATIFEVPTPFGSSEHPTGTPLMAIFLGPFVTAFLSIVVLLLELIFKEGGITTLGANVLSLGIIGGFAGWAVFKVFNKLKLGIFIPAFLAGFIGDLLVYAATAGELIIGQAEGKSYIYYFMAFIPLQLPIAIIEGTFTGLVIKFIHKRRAELLSEFKIL